ncbi:hypothetical protein BH10BAC5_BH10BAC5_07510 [soil metagenome]
MKRYITIVICFSAILVVGISFKNTEASTTNIRNFYTAPEDTLNPLPVELDRFVATTIKNEVILDWYTGHEHNNSGFQVERAHLTSASSSNRDLNYVSVGFMKGVGNTTIESAYRFRDPNVPAGKYAYRLKQIDFNGNFRYFVLNSEVVVSIPTKFNLYQNYPNPFNPVTHIRYELSSVSNVSLKIFDVSGKEIKSLVTGVQNAGYYDINVNASELGSGVYYFRLNAVYSNGVFEKTLKMMIVK